MNEKNDNNVMEKTERYLDEVERSLKMPADRAREIVDEMRADLMGLARRYQEEGRTESEAVDKALAEMGDAGDVARKISEVVPPLSSGWVKWVRYGVSAVVILGMLRVAWAMRAWTYGAGEMIVPLFLVISVPIVLILWPGIIWRKNWLFGLIPAGVAMVIWMAVIFGGSSKTMAVSTLSPRDEASVAAEIERAQAEAAAGMEKRRNAMPWVVSGIGLVTVFLLLAMQRDRQRRVAIGTILVVGLGIEGAFQVEEARFRRDMRDIGEAVKASGAVPDAGDIAKTAGFENASYQAHRDGNGYTVFWNRPLQRGFALVFDSETGKVRVND